MDGDGGVGKQSVSPVQVDVVERVLWSSCVSQVVAEECGFRRFFSGHVVVAQLGWGVLWLVVAYGRAGGVTVIGFGSTGVMGFGRWFQAVVEAWGSYEDG